MHFWSFLTIPFYTCCGHTRDPVHLVMQWPKSCVWFSILSFCERHCFDWEEDPRPVRNTNGVCMSHGWSVKKQWEITEPGDALQKLAARQRALWSTYIAEDLQSQPEESWVLILWNLKYWTKHLNVLRNDREDTEEASRWGLELKSCHPVLEPESDPPPHHRKQKFSILKYFSWGLCKQRIFIRRLGRSVEKWDGQRQGLPMPI